MENKFEKFLWNFRYITILAVILSILSAFTLILIGIVLLIFGFGIYELFVSEIDFANSKFTESTLKIRDENTRISKD